MIRSEKKIILKGKKNVKGNFYKSIRLKVVFRHQFYSVLKNKIIYNSTRHFPDSNDKLQDQHCLYLVWAFFKSIACYKRWLSCGVETTWKERCVESERMVFPVFSPSCFFFFFFRAAFINRPRRTDREPTT